jgi:hypothetical protein
LKVRVNINGIERIQKLFKDLPPRIAKVGMRAFAEWIIGDGERGLKSYQPYKYISRDKAYGKTFVSDRQRRYVMARIREGKIDPGVPHRTGQTQRGWEATPARGGYVFNIKNEAPGAYYTRHDEGQARLNTLAGWKKISQILARETAGAIRAARDAIKQALKGV